MASIIQPLGYNNPQPYLECGNQPATLVDRLKTEKEILEARLHRINAILDALDNNPSTRQILDMISELGGF